MNKIISLSIVALLACAIHPCFARNPDKPLPLQGGHGSSSVPSLPVVTPGGLTSPPGSSPKLTLGDYETDCQSSGRVKLDIRSENVNNHKQSFIHTEAEGSSVESPNIAIAWVLNGASSQDHKFINLALDTPITFQLLNGQSTVVIVTYALSHTSQPVTKIYGHPANGSPNQFKFVATGANTFMIPVGSDASQVPKGAIIYNVTFETPSGQNCTLNTSDLNNVRLGSTTVGITSGSKSCGEGCK